MKKFLSILLSAVVLFGAVSLFGCNKESGSTALQFWAYQPNTQADQNEFKDMLKEFTAETGIEVKPNFITKDDYKTTFNASLRAKNKPDVAYLDQPLVAKYAEEGVLYAMDDAIDVSEYLSSLEYFEGAYETTVYKGKTYALPLTITTSVLFYNKDLVSEPFETWDEWLAIAKTLDESQSGLFEGIGNGGYASWYFQVFLENVGGSFMNEDETAVTFNDAKGVEAANMIKDLYEATPKSIRDSSNAFGHGLIATKLGSSYDIDTITNSFPNLNFGVIKVPVPNEGDTSYSNIGGENLVVLESTKNKEDAMKLVEFLMRKENQEKISKFSGNFSTVKEYATVDESDPNRDKKLVVLDQLNTACARPSLPEWLSVNDLYLSAALEDILADDASADIIQEKLDYAARQATAILFS